MKLCAVWHRVFFDFGLKMADVGFFMISKLEKNSSVLEVLTKLFKQFGESNFAITDYWDADLCAIGIKNLTDRKHLIYICTYNLPKGLYFVEVEKANSETDLTDYKVVGDFNNIAFEELAEIVEKYLNLQSIYEQ